MLLCIGVRSRVAFFGERYKPQIAWRVRDRKLASDDHAESGKHFDSVCHSLDDHSFTHAKMRAELRDPTCVARSFGWSLPHAATAWQLCDIKPRVRCTTHGTSSSCAVKTIKWRCSGKDQGCSFEMIRGVLASCNPQPSQHQSGAATGAQMFTCGISFVLDGRYCPNNIYGR